jgi:HEAT repeat protein
VRWLKRRRGPEDWFRLHASAFADLDARRIDATEGFERRVEATWGLIGCGVDAIPYALEMLKSSDAEIREDAGGVLGALGREPEVVEAVIAALRSETDDQARDSFVIALGELGDRRAVPHLASLIRSEDADGDTRFTAALGLGRLVGRRFDRQDDALSAAIDWLDKHEA